MRNKWSTNQIWIHFTSSDSLFLFDSEAQNWLSVILTMKKVNTTLSTKQSITKWKQWNTPKGSHRFQTWRKFKSPLWHVHTLSVKENKRQRDSFIESSQIVYLVHHWWKKGSATRRGGMEQPYHWPQHLGERSGSQQEGKDRHRGFKEQDTNHYKNKSNTSNTLKGVHPAYYSRKKMQGTMACASSSSLPQVMEDGHEFPSMFN